MMDKKLKIAVFHNLAAGGAIKALQDNLSIFKSKGHHVDVYTTDISNYSFASLKEFCDNYYIYPVKRSLIRKFFFKTVEKFTNYKFNENSRVLIPYSYFKKTQNKIAEEIDAKSYDFVFFEQDFMFSYTPAFIENLKTLNIYYCAQPYRNNELILKKLDNSSGILKSYVDWRVRKFGKLDVKNAQHADYILCNSYFTHENILRSYGLNSKVSYLGINTNQFQAQNLPRKNIVLSVGSVTVNKGFEFIIKSIAKVDEKIRPKFIIVGYKSDKILLNYLESLATDLNVDLEVIQGIPYEDLVKLYNEVKIVLFAPYLEPFGLVPLEAMACGTPVIGVKEGGVKETVKHGENGLLLDRDEFIFAEGISELLTNQELWNKFSDYGPKYIEEFWTLEKAGERLLSNIYRILDEEKIKNS